MKINDLIKKFNSNLEKGLNIDQVVENRNLYGENSLKANKKESLFVKFLKQFKDVLIIILLIAAAVSIAVDPHEWFESLIILIVVVINAVLGVFQENKAEKSLEALKKMSSPTSKVIRNGNLDVVESSSLVVGDIILVEAGDFIPADCRIIECTNLKVDESALTGESVSVDKVFLDDEITEGGLGDKVNRLFSSTYVTNGKAKAIITSVGMETEIGKIANMLLDNKATLTPLQHKLEHVGKIIGFIAIIICIVVFIMEVLSNVNTLDAFKTAVALAVAAIPEGLATVVTIVLALGVEKMAKRNAIVKKMPAVETLGSTSVVCSDKTGTLTQNRMTVVRVTYDELKDVVDLSEEEKELLQYFAICCDASISNVDGEIKRVGDPTELALLDVANNNNIEYLYAKRVKDLPFDSERKLMTTVIEKNGKYLAITKGAPDVVFGISTNQYKISKMSKINSEMADEALRVLAIAIKLFDSIPTDSELEKEMELLGLVGMIDPAREEVKDSIALAKRAHIKTVMITGDHIVTAKAIARNLGILEDDDKAITSQELDELSDEYLEEHIEEYSVFARVAPKDKVRIVDAWQKRGAIVAMTGDGVNDAPALKRADIGCAMGITGTDVSKEAADMILVDDNFSTIISAVKHGRGIYANIQKCIRYLLSSNIGEVLTIFVASLVAVISNNGLGVPLLPIHLLWINLITDSLPAFGLGLEEADESVMDQKPRSKNESFFANKLGLNIAIEGVMVGGLTLASYLIGFHMFKSNTTAQTMAFVTLSCCQLFHAFNVKSEKSIFNKHLFENKFLNFAFVVGFALQMIIVYTPGLNSLFKLEALGIEKFGICLTLSLMTIVIMEIVKLIRRVVRK